MMKRNRKILIIDDDLKTTSYLLEELIETYSFDVVWLTKADNAIETLIKNEFDAVLLDIMMPFPESWIEEDRIKAENGLSTGLVLFDMVREKFKKLPIVFHTTKSYKSIDDHYTKFLRKPEFVSVIVENIENLME